MASVSEVRLWLESALSSRKFKEFSFDVTGGTEKGAGYASDVIFVHVTGKKNGLKEELDLVLKCSKTSKALRDSSPIKEVFHNEVTFFDHVLPTFVQYQKEKGFDVLVSDFVSKYVGKFEDADMEVIVLENLKKEGFELNDPLNPLTRKHVDLVIKAYANYHATSLAFKDQKPAEFDKLTSYIIDDLLAKFMLDCKMMPMFKTDIDEVYDCLKDKIDPKTLVQYKNLANHIEYIIRDMFKERKVSLMIHGDSWNNNFMFRINKTDNKPSKVAILDWQIIGISTPVRDLAYFILASISDQIVNDIDEILSNYYDLFADYVRKLGSDPDKLYPRNIFEEEWRKFAKFGILMSPMVLKVCTSKKEDICTMDEALEKGGEITDAFKRDVKNNPEFIRRVKSLLEYSAKKGLLEI